MKILIFSGSHSRHLYVQSSIVGSDVDYHAIVMGRENIIPETPNGLSPKDENNFIRHFEDRHEVEARAFGNLKPADVFDSERMTLINPEELNSSKVLKIVKSHNFDFSFIFGPDMIKDPVLSALPKYKINLHLGLSPWYKGSATLFWPFYFLEPQFAGITLHNITEKPDQGDIFHQSVPKLSMGDGIHDVAAKAVEKARNEVLAMIDKFKVSGELKLSSQKTSGRVWRTSDFEPAHLRVIYDLYDNDIVDHYLRGSLSKKKPILINGL
tara:strand:- start:8903 stop:9706 length:804 start_codon:yes stop_codon:yes gene_type:complete